MARPRRWETGDGSIPLFVPDPDDLTAVQADTISHEEYKNRYLRLVAFRVRKKSPPVNIVPGLLLASTVLDPVPVKDGDTLLCACSVEVARSGKCHRTWAASLLKLAGWDVTLDASPLSEEQARAFLRRDAP